MTEKSTADDDDGQNYNFDRDDDDGIDEIYDKKLPKTTKIMPPPPPDSGNF